MIIGNFTKGEWVRGQGSVLQDIYHNQRKRERKGIGGAEQKRVDCISKFHMNYSTSLCRSMSDTGLLLMYPTIFSYVVLTDL